jgi:ATP-dependent Clp protease adaptor protein ClpS
VSDKKYQEDGGVAIEEETRTRLKRPRLYKVILHNDDYTTMEFVTWILMEVFHHDESSAWRIMLHVHEQGTGVAGVYTYEIAETKVAMTLQLAQKAEFPLQCTFEPEDDPDDGESEDE